MSESYIESSWAEQDISFEVPLRPQQLTDFVGQSSVRARLDVFSSAAKERNEAIGHTLLCGPPGLGKTTLAHILSKTMGTNLVVTSGPSVERPKDLAGILTNLKEGDVLFIDEIHRLPKSVEEYLYPAMEDYVLDLLIDSGPNARTVQIKLNQFTLVGATTRSGLLSSPMRSRFPMNLRLDYYPSSELQDIVTRSAKILNIDLSSEGALEIAKRSRGTPRIANNLLRWVRDCAQIKKIQRVEKADCQEALEMLQIDELGLDEVDKKILQVIIDHYSGGPVGVQTLAIAIGEETTTVAEVYEPYLILQGFLKRTPRGREVTQLAYKHLGRDAPHNYHGDPS